MKNVWNAYGAALYRAAEFEKALGCFEKASSLFGFEYKPVYDMNHAAVLEKLGREDEAIELLRAVIQKNPVNKSSVYKRLIPLLEKRLTGPVSNLNSSSSARRSTAIRQLLSNKGYSGVRFFDALLFVQIGLK